MPDLHVEGLELLPEAEEELAAAAEWYDAERPGLGERFLDAVLREFARIRENPRQFAPWRANRAFRRAVVRRFPYVVFYVESTGLSGHVTMSNVARKKVKRFRFGAEEKRLVGRLVQATKRFKIYAAEKTKHETVLNKRLVKKLKKIVADVEGDLKKNDIKLVAESFRPDLAVPGDGAHPLLAVECKKPRGSLAKRNFKEVLSQALMYRLRYKGVILVFYDLTKAGR